jgi:hypothetical protein
VAQEGGPARHRDGDCGLGDSDRRLGFQKIPTASREGQPDDNASVAAHSSGSAAEDSDHIADSPCPVQALSTEQGVSFATISPSKRDFANTLQDQMSAGMGIRDIFEAVDPLAVP